MVTKALGVPGHAAARTLGHDVQDVALDTLAARVHEASSELRRSLENAVDAYLTIGQCLLEARTRFRSDQAYGEWFRAEGFAFSQQWTHVLRTAATHEPAVREAVTTQVVTGRTPNFRRVVREVAAAAKPAASPPSQMRPPRVLTAAATGGFPCVVADPPWRYDNTASRGAVIEHCPTMSTAQICAIKVPAADDAHLYLWVTNAHVREGFDVMDAWGFTFKTVLTWCKPQLGLGWWFRNATEHVLFGVRGTLRTLRNDVPTWFEAERGRHSEKPNVFYELVESCSPGPRLELFARTPRPGWQVWGNEVGGQETSDGPVPLAVVE